jgi:hypothetical protein
VFEVKEYKTGWDYGIRGDVIKAHAPSVLLLEVKGDITTTISPSYKEGANLQKISAIIIINNKTISIPFNQDFLVSLRKGDIVELKFDLIERSKDGAWTEWNIKNFKTHCLSNLYMNKHSRLGDSLAFLIALENLAEANNIDQISVCKKEIYKSIMNIFSFKHIIFVEGDGICLDNVFGSCSWEESWIERLHNNLAVCYGLKTQTIVHPQSKLENKNGDYIGVQLDTRSGKPLDKEACVTFLNKLQYKKKVLIIGGKDSAKYLGDGFDYYYGTLEEIANKLMECEYIIGADSGIAHLSCLLGIRTFVINTIEQRTVINFFRGYEKCRFVEREFIGV